MFIFIFLIQASDIQVFGHRQCLYGHSEAITMMSVCKPFSILVTASMDGTAIIWDLNRLCYVRSIQDHSAGVYALAISDTLGDIATASHSGKRLSDLCRQKAKMYENHAALV